MGNICQKNGLSLTGLLIKATTSILIKLFNYVYISLAQIHGTIEFEIPRIAQKTCEGSEEAYSITMRYASFGTWLQEAVRSYRHHIVITRCISKRSQIYPISNLCESSEEIKVFDR